MSRCGVPRPLAGLVEAVGGDGFFARTVRRAVTVRGGAVVVVHGAPAPALVEPFRAVAEPAAPHGVVRVAPAPPAELRALAARVSPGALSVLRRDPPAGCAWVIAVAPWCGALVFAVKRGGTEG